MICETSGCKGTAATNLRRTRDGKIFAVCRQCSEELLARPGWERLT